MRYLFLAALLLFALNARTQTLFSRICRNYDTAHYGYAYFGYCDPVQQFPDGSFLTTSLRGQLASEGINYFHLRVIKTDTAFRPQYTLDAPYLTTALSDGTIGCVSNENPDTLMSGLLFSKRSPDGNVISSKIIHSDWSYFSVNCISAVPAGMRLMTMPGHMFDSFGYTSFAPMLIDLDNNGYVVSADSIHIGGIDPEYLWPYKIDIDAAGNSITFINLAFGSQVSFVSKLTPDKTVLWSTQLTSHIDLYPFSSVLLPDGSVIFGNSYYSYPDSSRSILLKFSPSGTLVWQKESTTSSGISSMKLLPNGNILLVNGLNATYWWVPNGGKMITEIDADGNMIWSKVFKRPITGAMYDALSAPYIKSANEWNFAATTYLPYMVTLFNTDSNGHSLCEQEPISIAFTDANIIAVSPATMTLSHVNNVYSVYTTTTAGATPLSYDDGCIYDFIPPPVAVADVATHTTLLLFPNPATDNINIQLPNGEAIQDISIYDASGRQWLHTQPFNPQPTVTQPAATQPATTTINISSLPQGYYTIKTTTTNHILYYNKLTIIH